MCESLCAGFVLLMNQLSFGLPVSDRQTQRQAQSKGEKDGEREGLGGIWKGIVELEDYKFRGTEGNETQS